MSVSLQVCSSTFQQGSNMMELYYILIIIIVVVYFLLNYYFRRTFNYWKKMNVCGPEPLTFYGNFKETILRQKNTGVVFQDIYNMYPNEKIVGIYRMTTPALLVRDLDIIKHIMIKDFDKFMVRGIHYSKKGLGTNLFHSDAVTWRALRSRYSPLFSSKKLKDMFYLMNECTEKFIEMVDKKIRLKPEQEMRDLIQRYAVASIAACAFGSDFDSYSDDWEYFKKIDDLIFTPTYCTELDMLFPGILPKIGLSLFPRPVNTFFKNLMKTVIHQRNGMTTSRQDFVDVMLNLRQKGKVPTFKFGDENTLIDVTDDMIGAQALVFYVAGNETSAAVLVYMLHQLAMNPHVQEKLVAEIDEMLNANNYKITHDTLKDMKYLDKVLNETLRMHSIVEPLQRQANEDYKIPGTDAVIKKGTIVFVSPRGINYDEKYYPNPDVFDPERFAPEEARNRHPCSFLSFGTGPRNCIGMRFGQLQTRLCVVRLLSKYRLEPSEHSVKNLEVEPSRIVIGPKGKVYLNLIPRK